MEALTPATSLDGGFVVVLNGFPGTGKYTILRQLQTVLPRERTRLVDNHLLIDPVHALIPDRSDAHHRLRRLLRAPYFQVIRELALGGNIILMTACLAEDGGGRDTACLREHLDIVRDSNIPLFWINVHCELAVLEQRVVSQERASKTKLMDLEIARKLVNENILIEPSEGDNIIVVTKRLDASGSLEESVNRLLNIIGMSVDIMI